VVALRGLACPRYLSLMSTEAKPHSSRPRPDGCAHAPSRAKCVARWHSSKDVELAHGNRSPSPSNRRFLGSRSPASRRRPMSRLACIATAVPPCTVTAASLKSAGTARRQEIRPRNGFSEGKRPGYLSEGSPSLALPQTSSGAGLSVARAAGSRNRPTKPAVGGSLISASPNARVWRC
jgi:hypothetical protein